MPLGRSGEPVGEKKMAKRGKVRPTLSGAARKPAEGPPDMVHSSLYLPGPVYEALREIAFLERLKIHDVVMQGIDLALRKRGYPAVDDLRGRKR